jgi:hypothetical protein
VDAPPELPRQGTWVSHGRPFPDGQEISILALRLLQAPLVRINPCCAGVLAEPNRADKADMLWPYYNFSSRFDAEAPATMTEMCRALAVRLKRYQQRNQRIIRRIREALQLA